ncbi:hypothetical protein T08_684 [Trichinella sp. T8]|nr:hypothetical protein T08_684 [Trichinella sp. T8]
MKEGNFYCTSMSTYATNCEILKARQNNIKVPTCVDNRLQLSGRQQLTEQHHRTLAVLMTERGQLVTNDMSTSLQIVSN